MAMAKYPPRPVLVVDDEQSVIQACKVALHSSGIHNTRACLDSRNVLEMMEAEEIGVLLLDLSMPHVSGEQLLKEVTSRYPDVPVIIVTGVNDINVAIECMKGGAYDYLLKPIDRDRLHKSVRNAVEMRELRTEYASFKSRVLENRIEDVAAFSDIVTKNSKMRAIFQYVETIATTERPVLITGDTGVGKDLIAKALHKLSGRTGEFVSVNVGGLDDNIFSDTLFGHTKGSFTGADQARPGLIARASGGTLFLDEIGDLAPASQVKLLRLLQDGDYLPIGADVPKRTDARIVVATNRDLKALQESNDFRSDLFYRLRSHQVHIPPLRERLDDLPLLLDHFLEKSATELNKRKPTPPRELLTLLATYAFPGNIRELDTMIFDAVSRHESKILSMERFKEHIEDNRGSLPTQVEASKEGASAFALFEELPTLKESQRQLIMEAMSRAQNNQSLAAKLLGITQSGLSKALKREGLS